MVAYRQQVPRPPGGGPPLPPPWKAPSGPAASPGHRRVPTLPLGIVRAALARGAGAWEDGPVRQRVEAAVLVALYGDGGGDEGEATVVLIRRSSLLERDPGHVALPGGFVEPGEEPRAAALREAEEEIGLDPGAVEILGRLATVERPRHQGSVAPFVGVLPGRPALLPSPDEVEAVLEVPLAHLLAEGVAWEERWPLAPGEGPDAPGRLVRFFACETLGDDLVWGVTAKILWDLLERVVAPAGP